MTNFLGKKKSDDHIELVESMISNLQELRCSMGIKIYFLHSYLDRFPQNLGDFSEEQGERSHQDLRTMEERYQGWWDSRMMADFCWTDTSLSYRPGGALCGAAGRLARRLIVLVAARCALFGIFVLSGKAVAARLARACLSSERGTEQNARGEDARAPVRIPGTREASKQSARLSANSLNVKLNFT
ncbi:hypothetical protein EVAR_62322_1 [Eumeta japonica]|uniref:Uncharacterized protein n=1 Tax=Eumeta variegata TaxID=151549 RepID=A0A4C1ZEU8_EUMVA|nr:hypothetical protein EVAR_62322_1 [Eumeta japonica]